MRGLPARVGAAVLYALAAAPLVAPALAAQVTDGNRYWTEGRFPEAKAAYEAELRSNPASVRSLYRLAVLASWADRLDSARTLADRARGLEPADPDVRALQAQLDAWSGRFRSAVARYDSLGGEMRRIASALVVVAVVLVSWVAPASGSSERTCSAVGFTRR